MPAFLIVTGYLSRSFRWSRRHLRRLVAGVALPYVVFEGLLVLFREEIAGGDYNRLWIEPHWPMWFLAALFIWRLATPLIQKVPHALTLAVVVSLLGGLHQFEVLDLDRVFGFLPFFVAGLMATPEHVARLRTVAMRKAAVGVVVAGMVLPFAVNTLLRTEWLYYRSSYATLEVSALEGFAARLALLAVSFLLALAFLSWMPSGHGWFTKLGAATLVVYLFHGFAVKAAEYGGFPDWAGDHPLLAFVIGTAGAVALAMVLAAPPVARRLSLVVEPTSAVRPLLETRR
jgi:fucose 4-O-acetylase-like acetyltransferase